MIQIIKENPSTDCTSRHPLRRKGRTILQLENRSIELKWAVSAEVATHRAQSTTS